jgi:hypothetical protein
LRGYGYKQKYLEVTILSPLELKETDQTVEVCPLCIKNGKQMYPKLTPSDKSTKRSIHYFKFTFLKIVMFAKHLGYFYVLQGPLDTFCAKERTNSRKKSTTCCTCSFHLMFAHNANHHCQHPLPIPRSLHKRAFRWERRKGGSGVAKEKRKENGASTYSTKFYKFLHNNQYPAEPHKT